MTTLPRMTAGRACGLGTLSFSWPVSARRGGGACQVRVSVCGPVARVELWPEGGAASELSHAAVTRVADDGLLHLHAPGVLTATVRLGAEGPALLYARTPLLETLGVPGGTADRPVLNTDPADVAP